MQSYKPVLKLPANTAGRDFVVGDLHGCLQDFLILKKHLKFDPAVDRMFSVGDLVDRGPDSVGCAQLMYEPWFFAVMGNHEKLCYDTVLQIDPNMYNAWIHNGGDWHRSVPHDLLVELAKRMSSLPLVITVGEGENRFNVVHAELSKHSMQIRNHIYQGVRVLVTDNMIDTWGFDRNDEGHMLWGRNMIHDKHVLSVIDQNMRFHSKDLSLTFVGHTVLEQCVQLERQIYLDLGGVFMYYEPHMEEGKIVVADVANKVLHQLATRTKEVTTVSFDSIIKLHQ